MNAHHQLKSKIERGEAVVGVVGLGYVGLPLAAAFHDADAAAHRVVGFDIDPKKIETLARGGTYLKHLGEELTKRLASTGRFQGTTDFSRLAECDAVCVCVPTPLDDRHEPDLSYVLRTGEAIGRTLRAGQLIVLESTTYPGTTRDVFAPTIERAHRQKPRLPESSSLDADQALRMSDDWFCAFSPERENPGDPSHTTRTIPKLVGGLDDRSAELAATLYRRAIRKVVVVSSAEIAESAKLLENIFRAVNIALVNEMKMTLDAMGIDIWDVVRAASTKPFGFMPFYPGPGMGGHCIPVDPFYLSWKARQVGQPARFIELAGEVNVRMPRYVIERTIAALASRAVPIDSARVLILGLAYKPDIDDVRESPSFELITLLRDAGAEADYSDPHVPATWAGRRHDLGMKSVSLSPESLASYDAVIVSTDHHAFDYALIARHARLVIDTRDAMRAFEGQMGERLIRA